MGGVAEFVVGVNRCVAQTEPIRHRYRPCCRLDRGGSGGLIRGPVAVCDRRPGIHASNAQPVRFTKIVL